MHSLKQSHFQALKRILRYLRGITNYALKYTVGPLHLHAFSDLDWARDISDIKSTSGFSVYFGNNPIMWYAKKQNTATRSSAKVEYRCLASTVAELCWLRMLLGELKVSLQSIPTIWCNSSSAISLAYNPVFHARTKHIELDCHFIQEKVLQRLMQVHHISTDE